MLQIVGQFGGALGEDPHAHLKSFIVICNTFVIPNITLEGIRRTLFRFSLRDETKQWVYSLEPSKITTWAQVIEKFLKKYFPPTKNEKRRRDIANF